MGSYCGRSAKIRRNNDASGRLVLENFTRFAACGIGFHRIPTYRNGHQIHPDWMVGTNLRESHGCIRLPKAFSAKVWRFGRSAPGSGWSEADVENEHPVASQR